MDGTLTAQHDTTRAAQKGHGSGEQGAARITPLFNTHPGKTLARGYLKTGQPYTLVVQGPDSIDALLSLQDKVISALPGNNKYFISRKDRAFFERHFANGGTVIGIHVQGRLAGQSVIVTPTAQNPQTGMPGMEMFAPESVSVLQGVLVDPSTRRQGLMQVMIDAWLDHSRAQGRVHALAKVSAENEGSWKVFLRKGLEIHSTGERTDNGKTYFNLHAVLAPHVPAAPVPATVPAQPLRSIL